MHIVFIEVSRGDVFTEAAGHKQGCGITKLRSQLCVVGAGVKMDSFFWTTMRTQIGMLVARKTFHT
jgi:hypothetical protein